MTQEASPPPSSPEENDAEALHIQLGKHLSLYIKIQVSPHALTMIVTALAALGGGAWGIMQR